MLGTIIFLAVSILVINGVAILVPKRLTLLEIYITTIFVLLFQTTLDTVLDLKYDLYGYFSKGLDLESYIVFFGLYPAASVLILNYFPFHKPMKSRVLYMLAVTALCSLFEWVSEKTGYYYYHNWSIFLSILCYPASISTLVWNLWFVRKLSKR